MRQEHARHLGEAMASELRVQTKHKQVYGQMGLPWFSELGAQTKHECMVRGGALGCQQSGPDNRCVDPTSTAHAAYAATHLALADGEVL